MERTTHTIETPVSKHKVVIRDFLLGGEKRSIANETNENERQNKMITTLCVSVDGKVDNVVEALDTMHGKDFDFVIYEMTKVAEASSLPSEKKAS